MSMTRALSNAMSGLKATARGTELVSANLANIMTPGYARRELSLSAETLGANTGGVKVEGVVRAVNAGVLSQLRMADATQSEASVLARFFSGLESVVGMPGEGHAMTTALTDFQVALSAASVRPEDELRLSAVLRTANQLADQFNTASRTIQASRTEAEQQISAGVDSLNTSLEHVAELNRRITLLTASGKDASSLLDERQRLISEISRIVPVQEVQRDGGKVSLFTTGGAVLLDGTTPARFGFSAIGEVQPQHTGAAPLSYLTVDGVQLTAGQMKLFEGGALAGHFVVRDDLAPRMQQALDELAYDLQARFADAGVDPTLLPGQAGMFTDMGQPADLANLPGLSQRFAVHQAIDPELGGSLWRIRAGVNAAESGPVSDATILGASLDALDARRPSAVPGSDHGNSSIIMRAGQFSSQISTGRFNAEADLALSSARANTLTTLHLADGVDSDAEMQRLLQYEKAYAANARVIRAIDEMLNNLLRI